MALLREPTNLLPETVITPDAASSERRGRSATRFSLKALTFHLTLLVFLVGSQVAQVPTRGISADNSWHFRLARDILSGHQIYWSAVDANRLFPDLLYSLAAYALPGGGTFGGWIYYYHIINTLVLYGSLVALAATVSDEPPRRRLFLFLAISALSLFMIALPFWGFWLMVPGNHGASLPVAFLCLSLIFAMNVAGTASVAGSMAFLLLMAAVIASNRLLLITLAAPLAPALTVGLLLRWHAGRGQAGALPGLYVGRVTALRLFLIALPVAASLGGLWLWQVLSSLRWITLVAPGNLPPLSLDANWLEQTLTKELSELQLAFTTSFAWDIRIGLATLVAGILGGAFATALALRRPLMAEQENRAVLSSFAAMSAVAAMAFTLVKTDDTGTWHYRYAAMSIAFTVVSLSCLPLWFERLSMPRRMLEGFALVALIGGLAAIVLVAERSRRPYYELETTYEPGISQLTRILSRYSNASKLRGYAEYWLANDLSTRSDKLQVGILDSLKPDFRFYNNNAADLCGDGQFFILHSPKKNEPKREEIVARLGEPSAVEQVELAQHEVINAMIYDPAVIKARITDSARQTAMRLFPAFHCTR